MKVKIMENVKAYLSQSYGWPYVVDVKNWKELEPTRPTHGDLQELRVKHPSPPL